MALSFRFRKVRLLVPLVLLIMILMRLVWVNLRQYPPTMTAPAGIAVLHLAQSKPSPCSLGTWEQVSAPQALGGVDLAGAMMEGVPSPGLHWLGLMLCNLPEFESGIDLSVLIKWNQWLLLATVFLGILLGRFLTSSWNLALIAGVVLLSRGSFLREIGQLGGSVPTAFLYMLWFTVLVHHFRTGSLVSAALIWLTTLVGVLLDPANLNLTLTLPVLTAVISPGFPWIVQPAVQRVRELRWHMNSMGNLPPAPSLAGRMALTFQWLLGPIREDAESPVAWQPNLKPGWVFRTIDVPYMFWMIKSGRGHRHFWLWLGSMGVIFFLGLSFYSSWYSGGLNLQGDGAQGFVTMVGEIGGQFWQVMDLHYGVSLAILVCCAVQYPADGLMSLQEAVWVLLITIGLGILGAALVQSHRLDIILQLQDFIGNDTFTLRETGAELAYWFEPIVLVMGVAGAYHLIKVGDSRRLRRLMSSGR